MAKRGARIMRQVEGSSVVTLDEFGREKSTGCCAHVARVLRGFCESPAMRNAAKAASRNDAETAASYARLGSFQFGRMKWQV